MKNILKILKISLYLFLLSTQNVFSDENKIIEKDHEWNFYSGMFDFSDDGKRASLFGIQHQNENLTRKSFLGTLSPVTGFMVTADSATYAYTGVQAQYKIGKLNIIPSFTPGFYGEGNGKDLGHVVEFKSEVQLSLDIFSNSELGFSYNHISNASLGDKNPGANSYMFNFLKRF
jgi:lipid A 3-O-deacylase|tara:strand:- start:258 stop:779 length:522 start_codon:yes stop_codon:yes gene_type:complete